MKLVDHYGIFGNGILYSKASLTKIFQSILSSCFELYEQCCAKARLSASWWSSGITKPNLHLLLIADTFRYIAYLHMVCLWRFIMSQCQGEFEIICWKSWHILSGDLALHCSLLSFPSPFQLCKKEKVRAGLPKHQNTVLYLYRKMLSPTFQQCVLCKFREFWFAMLIIPL